MLNYLAVREDFFFIYNTGESFYVHRLIQILVPGKIQILIRLLEHSFTQELLSLEAFKQVRQTSVRMTKL